MLIYKHVLIFMNFYQKQPTRNNLNYAVKFIGKTLAKFYFITIIFDIDETGVCMDLSRSYDCGFIAR